ncbi:MAG: hypothetical protein IKX65_06440 [Prevotella sp.]|nr:hypothetical protein [Prevotella sp.]
MPLIILKSKEEYYNEHLHYVKSFRPVRMYRILTVLAQLHSEFYNRLNTVFSHLLNKYGELWCPIDIRSAEEMATESNMDDIYKKIIFVAEKLDNRYGAIFDESTNLMRVCCAIRTKDGYVIIREIYFDINPAILIPFIIDRTATGRNAFTIKREEYWGLIYQDDKEGKPFGIDKLLEMLSGNSDEGRIVFRIEETKTSKEDKQYTYCRFSLQNIDFYDDIGKCFTGFSNSPHLLRNSFSEDLLKESFPLNGTAYYAPYSKKSDIYCVLYAQLDNPHDPNAVKVLRWFPCKKYDNNPISQSLYELGYIARNSNIELHNEMCRSGNRFLFGFIENNMVKIIGNAKEFTINGKLRDYCPPYVLFKYVK